MRLLALAVLLLFAGAALVLGEIAWFARRPLVERLLPYTTALPPSRAAGAHAFSASSLRDVISPIALDAGATLARLVGIDEPIGVRLERVHSALDVAGFRVRQLGAAGAAFGAAAVVAVALAVPPGVALVLVLAAPLVAALVVEQSLARRSARRQARLLLELPVVIEQFATLLGAGYSVGATVERIAARGHGVCADDLGRVVARVRHGLSETAALREWATVSGLPNVRRLVSVLALDRDAGDLGRLVAEEARAVRREVQRTTLELLERRAQQVWVPVTIATLVPGAVFLAAPFIEAMRLFST